MYNARGGVCAAAVCLAALLGAGCGPKDPLGRQAVTGTVRFRGAALDQGSIEFSPIEGGPKTAAGGPVKEGRFRIAKQQGLAPGTYRVRVFSADAAAAPVQPDFPGEHGAVPRERIPPEWNSRSDKQITVTPDGPNDFSFDIP